MELCPAALSFSMENSLENLGSGSWEDGTEQPPTARFAAEKLENAIFGRELCS